MAESIEQLSFELTANALSEQERALAGLRTCAGTVLAAASIAGSFLGARTGHGSLNAWASFAVASFAFCSISALWVLLPHRFVFAVGGDALASTGARSGVSDVSESYRAASAWIRLYLQANNRKIAGLSSWLIVSCLLLTTEIIMWSISLTG